MRNMNTIQTYYTSLHIKRCITETDVGCPAVKLKPKDDKLRHK